LSFVLESFWFLSTWNLYTTNHPLIISFYFFPSLYPLSWKSFLSSFLKSKPPPPWILGCGFHSDHHDHINFFFILHFHIKFICKLEIFLKSSQPPTSQFRFKSPQLLQKKKRYMKFCFLVIFLFSFFHLSIWDFFQLYPINQKKIRSYDIWY
jgi:hypothetical protein